MNTITRAALFMLLLVFMAVPTALAVDCDPTGGWAGLDQRLADRRFDDLSCDNWVSTGVMRSYFADECTEPLFSNYMADFPGGPNYTRTLYQDVEMPSSYTSADLEFMVDLKGDLTSSDKLVVTIRNPSTNAVLETVTTIYGNQSSLDCGSISEELDSDYDGETIRVQFQAVFSGSASASERFIIDESAIWTW